MKKFLFGLLIVAFLSTVNIGAAHASVNDFIIRDFQTDYYLDKDAEGRALLKTTELITAEFPVYDQNHGIERAVPTTYDGHSVNLNVQSITDQNDKKIPYILLSKNGNSVIRIGDANTYVHGINIYKITYSQRDTTRYFKDTNDDEFYWDVNGTDWAQSIDKVTARLHVGSNIINDLTDKKSCYSGVIKSTDICTVTRLTDRYTRMTDTYTVTVSNLKPGENITIAIGFKPHTFAEYVMSKSEVATAIAVSIYFAAGLVLSLVTIVLLILMFRLKITKSKGVLGRGVIIAEYLPPKNVDIALSSVIMNIERTWTSAMYIDLAVRHKIKIIERKEGFFKRTAYSLELISHDGLTDTESAVISALFHGDIEPGNRHDFPLRKFDSALSTELKDIYKMSKNMAKKAEYYEDVKALKGKMIKMTVAIGVMSIFTSFVGILATIIGVLIIVSIKPFTTKGRELFDYLKGLELYIKIAEEDRIKVLQSPKGAEKTPIDTTDSEKLVHLYERVLPYAVLFGNEKEWAGLLGIFYGQKGISPDWYVGNDMFNAVLFSSALSSFSSNTVSNSYSSPSSSSSGGSGGGGFSGGGGGGGGGGGW